MKRPALMVGAAILVIAAGATAAWWKLQPPPAAPPSSPSEAATEQVATAPPAIDLPEQPAPPEPTSADFGARAEAPLPTVQSPAVDKDAPPVDWAAMPIEALRARANAEDVKAMEELARRLVHGAGVPKDQQAGAGWLLRAARRGSAQSAFNVAVMYERGFVVERDSTKAVEWYRKAAEANLPVAKHNLALLLRDGKGAPRDVKEALDLLRSAARQGMAASMFALGDMHERGDAGVKDQAIALAWFAITAEFERQTNRGNESELARMASQRMQVLQRALLPGDLERAQQFGQAEFKQIVEALQPPKPALPASTETGSASASAPPAAAEADQDPPGWPKVLDDQVRVIQQALFDLSFLRDKPDGALGPMTRNAIRMFQRSAAMRETGEPSRELFTALQEAIARSGAAKTEPAKADAANADIPAPDTPPPPTSSDLARAMSPAEAVAWPATPIDQIKAIQTLLRDLNFSREAPDGVLGPATRTAIRDFERSLGLAQTGEASKAVFDALQEMRAITPKAN